MSGLPAPLGEAPAAGLPLFAYGTLCDEEFVERLLERRVATADATLVDFRRWELEGLGYPVVVEEPGGRVDGTLYRGLVEEDYRRLDAYEGVREGLYARRAASVLVGGEELRAWVYVGTPKTMRRWS